ncbi:F-box protein At5g39450 isoform X2 [Neltuma alba]|uniref:F-box protein At5g39450 isoform X2 n=1 Tax=Neltuma alba TaxID=207710 RepID=UPI0010A3DE34|nr:F-box protein At5g39450-like isoform X2 [Prosopis alba]
MLPKPFDSCLLQTLPDDLFAIVSQFLSPSDVCNLSLCCRSLYALAASEKVWLTQCDMVDILPRKDIVEWRKGVSSYKALCRFLTSVQPLVGMWVHQNPELGNVVYVIPGFVSIVGCRVIPQELGPLGMEDGPILWAPVFEILGDSDGSTAFFLHGRENGINYIYPGFIKQIERTCNVLLLEIEPTQQKCGDTFLQSHSMVHRSDGDLSGNICSSNSGLSRSHWTGNNESVVPFSKLGFSDRRRLLEIITCQVRQKVPDMALELLFPRFSVDKDNFQKDLLLLSGRRSLLIQMYKLNSNGIQIDEKASSQEAVGAVQLELDEVQTSIRSWAFGTPSDEVINYRNSNKRKSLGGAFWHSLKHILRKSSSNNGCHAVSEKVTSSSESKHARLDEFLRSSDAVKLTLHASTVKLSSYRAWPNMHDSRFALYKLRMPVPTVDQEYAGLWGGTFGWPPGKPSKDKSGKALFLLLLSYEESEGQQLLIATKILEGTHYVLHPNGSAMFIVNTNEPSSEPFPWDPDVDSFPVNIEHAFVGEGIATGYGFRYPGSKPGSLFVFNNGVLAFIWKESRAVLTLQRLNLHELLKKGEMVPALSPVANFSYLTKSYSNVFAGFQTTSPYLPSPRLVPENS